MNEILTGIADLIFPPRCNACGELLEQHAPLPFCPPCMAGIRLIDPPLCPRCGTPFPATETVDHLCGECLITARPYAVARSVGRYEGTLLAAIHRFKYRGRTGIGELLGQMMADFVDRVWDMSVFEAILPVPLHKRRLRERGFNQAVILARGLERRFGIPLEFTWLTRDRFTPPQVGLDKVQRSENVRGAFRVVDPERIAGRRLLLVDDVYTTGSTLSECARVLIRAKAEAVAVLTMARAVYDHDRLPGAEPVFSEQPTADFC